MDSTILYNPECSKSKELINIAKKTNIKFRFRNYLTHPLSKREVLDLISILKLANAEEILRPHSGKEHFAIKAGDISNSIAAKIATNPGLLQRPIVILKGKALIARPPTLAIEFINRLSSSSKR